uniref:T-cell receptor alpha/delta variable 1 n=1 Tax=Astyanax mexicanus TaxID=7994 RepID=A0A3B1IPR9_ASTMX
MSSNCSCANHRDFAPACETADPIRPDQSSISITEGKNTTLSCTYEGTPWSLHWYQKKPGSRPEFLVLFHLSSKQVTKAQLPDVRLTIKLQANSSKVNLEISSTAVSDSALYYCALQPTVTETHQTLY